MISKIISLTISFFLLCTIARADQLNVVVTMPEFKELFEAIGGSKVKVASLLDGREDPHFIDAVPSFISKAARADIVCAVGLDLEVGWLPKVLSKSGNAKIQRGGKGFCELGEVVDVLEKHKGVVDRSMGDVHAGGNPHFYLSPSSLKKVAIKIAALLSEFSPQNKEFFSKNLAKLLLSLDKLKVAVAEKLKPLRKAKMIQFHKEFSYFMHEYGLQTAGAIEEKPGVPPSGARISNVSLNSKAADVALAIGSFHTPINYLKKFTEFSGIPHIKLPASAQLKNEKLDTIAEVQNYIADQLLKQIQSNGSLSAVR